MSTYYTNSDIGTAHHSIEARPLHPDGDPAVVDECSCRRNADHHDLSYGSVAAGVSVVDVNGRITRKEAADLCRISPDQSYRLLKSLMLKSKIRMHGTKRGSWYEKNV